MDSKSRKIDDIDRKILNILQTDNRITVKELAKQIYLSPTPVFERIKKLERKGFILKNIALLNPNLLGLKLIAFVSISLSEHSKPVVDNFIERIIQYPQVMECHHTSGNFDFLLRIIVEDMEEYNAFLLNELSSIKDISHVESHFSLSTKKYTHVLPIKNI